MKFYNKCSKNSRSQIASRTDIFRKLTLGAPAICGQKMSKGFLKDHCLKSYKRA